MSGAGDPHGDPGTLTDGDLAGLVHALADAVVIADTEGTITFCNDAAERLFGWSADEVVGRPLDLIIAGRERDRHWDGYRRVIATGRPASGGRRLGGTRLRRDGGQLSRALTVTRLAAAG